MREEAVVVDVFPRAGVVVGENPVWSERDQLLYYVDIVGRSVHALDPRAQVVQAWPTPSWATSIALAAEGMFIVGLAREVCLWRPGQAFEPLAIPDPDMCAVRLNEGAVSPDGHFWVCTLQENLTDFGLPTPVTSQWGAYYSVDTRGRVSRLTERAYAVPNSAVWLEDGRFFSVDTRLNKLYASHRGSEGAFDRTEFAHDDSLPGLPDGSCIDDEGFIWNCRIGGGMVVRYAPSGAVNRIIDLPCRKPTSCTFGGPNLSTLFVTTSRLALERPNPRAE